MKEAAEDYLNDGIVSDFWEEMSNMKEVKTSLEKAIEEHEVIKGLVKSIEERAKGNVETFKTKANKAKALFSGEDDEDCTDIAVLMSLPVVAQGIGGIAGAAMGGERAMKACKDTKYFDNLPSTIVAGAVGALGGLVAGTLIAIPAQPYLLCKVIANHFDAENYGLLQQQFENIALQMGLVEKHLKDITVALGEIEQHLKQAMKAQERVVVASEGEKRRKMVSRVIKRAEELIQTCDNYFRLVADNAATAPVDKTEADGINYEGDLTIQPRY